MSTTSTTTTEPSTPNTPMGKEPVVTVGTITGLVAAVIGAAVVFGAPMTEEQKVAIVAVFAIVAPFLVGPISGLIARRYVSPVGKGGRHADRDGVMDGRDTPTE